MFCGTIGLKLTYVKSRCHSILERVNVLKPAMLRIELLRLISRLVEREWNIVREA